MVVAELMMDTPHCQNDVIDIVDMLVDELAEDIEFYFFKDHEMLPADADCTALGLSVMLRAGLPIKHTCEAALHNIQRYALSNPEGIVTTYFVPEGDERSGILDRVVACNVLYLAHQMGKEGEFQSTLKYVEEQLVTKEYLKGSRYYYSPDTFLFFLGRVLHSFPASPLSHLKPILAQEVRERIGTTSHPLDLSQRVMLSVWFGVDAYHSDLDTLIGQQSQPSGAWPLDSLFQYGRKAVYFGSEALSTAFALAALDAAYL
jgi:hypothetical protein